MRENYYYGQGKVFLAPRDNKRAFRWVGDVSSLKIAFSYEQQITKASRGGKLHQNQRIITGASGSISSTWHDFSVENLALLLGAQKIDEPFSGNERFELPDGIVKGDIIALPHTTVFNVNIAGSQYGVDYIVNRTFGTIEFISTPDPGVNTVEYDHLYNRWLSLFSVKPLEFCLRFHGVNLADSSSSALLELYRISVDPLAVLEMINSGNDIASLEMTSLILPDFTQPFHPIFNHFGRLQIISDTPGLIYNNQAKYDEKHQYRGY
ncbi:TPA: hypothetical protein JHJ56_003032 [Raoultella ornithinolytica]|nr:hypothetical protein [Raoultella ornithinolytica]HAV2052187.1 hypothetical protein [Raoultella ornithinolytica]